jgi:hypothetical protein
VEAQEIGRKPKRYLGYAIPRKKKAAFEGGPES